MDNIKLQRIEIENFKSINSKISIDIDEYDRSYTKVLIGLNEAGKSNILEAISLFNRNKDSNYDFVLNRNRNNESEYISIDFIMVIKNLSFCIKELSKNIPEELLTEINNLSLTKQMYVGKENQIKIYYNLDQYFDLSKDFDLNLYLISNSKYNIVKKTNNNSELESNGYEQLNKDLLRECLENNINDPKIVNFNIYEPLVSIWKSEDKYLISKPIDLNNFANNPDNISPSLKNIFYLCGFNTIEKIKQKINEILKPEYFSSKNTFLNNLSKYTTSYINKIWKEHNIKIDFVINASNIEVNITDKDENGCYNMTERSQGFKQFISLILSLSIKNDYDNFNNNIVLIDEPETHLHPSGIRYMQKELLKIGKNNYVFIATHSFFMVDNNVPERHLLITNNKETKIKKINEKNVYDEEVLREAFGTYFYKDLMVTNKILVEGASDKTILNKVLKKEIKNDNNLDFRITNGCGSNIVQICSLFDNRQIENLLVIVDDDKDGIEYKKKIIKIGGNYSDNNVFTIRDICGDVINNGTIEDLLPIDFLQSKLKDFFKNKKITIESNFEISGDKPFIEKVKILLKERYKDDKEKIEEELMNLKTEISNDYEYSESRAPKLKKFAEEIIKKLKNKN